jgi:hypothetical protein
MGVQSDGIGLRYSSLPTIHPWIWYPNAMAKSADIEAKSAAGIAGKRYLISCFSWAAACSRLLPILQESPEKPLFSPAKQGDFVTTDQQVSGSTPDGCTTSSRILTGNRLLKNSRKSLQIKELSVNQIPCFCSCMAI